MAFWSLCRQRPGMDLSCLPRPFTRPEALSAGVSRLDLDEALITGLVERLSRGLYAACVPVCPGGEEWEVTVAEHLDRLHHQLRRHPGHVASHTSAALVHGLAVTISPASPVEITALDGYATSRRKPGLVIHHCNSGEAPVQSLSGIRVTTVERTVVDTARTRRLPHGTAVVDGALRDGAVTRDSLIRTLDGQRRWRGRPKAVAAVAMSDPRRESWLESYSFAALHEQGIALPLSQVDIYGLDGRFRGRVDGLLPDEAAFLEADGKAKYFMGAGPGSTPEQTVLTHLGHETARHAALESLGLRGIRWMSDEIVADAGEVAGRIRQRLASPVPHIEALALWQGELRRLPFDEPRPCIDMETLRTRKPRRRRSA